MAKASRVASMSAKALVAIEARLEVIESMLRETLTLQGKPDKALQYAEATLRAKSGELVSLPEPPLRVKSTLRKKA